MTIRWCDREIRALIEAAPNLNVVGEASDGREAVEQIGLLQPELVLMDVAMAGLNGIDAARQVHASLPETRIIMLSMHEDRQYVFEALKAGATGYVLKSAAFQDLMAAIETVMSNRNYISPALSDTVMNDYIRRAQGEEKTTELGRLSGREREVLQLIAEGKEQRRGGQFAAHQRENGGHASAQHHDQAGDSFDRGADQVRDSPWVVCLELK